MVVDLAAKREVMAFIDDPDGIELN